MDFNELKQIVELFSSSKIDRLDLDHDGFSLKLGKNRSKLVAAAPAAEVAVTAAPQEPAGPAAEEEDPGLFKVTSPIVGTFYRAPNPKADPFVRVGDHVKKGQTLCIVEAMKLMNEIQAEHDGQVVKFLAENSEGVEFGQDLMQMKLS